jgi:predicted Zn finger-like uncharacterized protein
MDRATKFVCPHCRTGFRSAVGIDLGKKVRCPYCLGRFVVRASDDKQSAPTVEGAQARLNAGRLALAVGGVSLYLLAGAALGYDCCARTDPSYRSAWAATWAGPAVPDDTPQPPAPPPVPQTTAPVSDAEQENIDSAIVKGVWYLRKVKIAPNTEGVPGDVEIGVRSLAALTLLECGVSAGDPLIQADAAFVRQKAPGAQTSRDTYQLALALLFLDRLGDKQDEELIQFLALRLIAGQRTDDGGWGYFCPPLARTETAKLLQLLRDSKPLADWHTAALQGKAFNPNPARSDNSNTQFAVLALWVARRHGVDTDKVIPLVEKNYRNHTDGLWWYSEADKVQNNSAWPTMTCSGLLGLAVAHGASENTGNNTQKPLDDPAITKALTVLASAVDKPKPESDLYFLWSLERVAVLYNLPKINGKDWYGWGAKGLRDTQRRDGGWPGQWLTGNSDVVSTCFALLFLKQANLASDLSNKLQLLAKEK